MGKFNVKSVKRIKKPRVFNSAEDDLLRSIFEGQTPVQEDADLAIQESIRRLTSPEYKARMEQAGLSENEQQEWVNTLISNMQSAKIKLGKRPNNVPKNIRGRYNPYNHTAEVYNTDDPVSIAAHEIGGHGATRAKMPERVYSEEEINNSPAFIQNHLRKKNTQNKGIINKVMLYNNSLGLQLKPEYADKYANYDDFLLSYLAKNPNATDAEISKAFNKQYDPYLEYIIDPQENRAWNWQADIDNQLQEELPEDLKEESEALRILKKYFTPASLRRYRKYYLGTAGALTLGSTLSDSLYDPNEYKNGGSIKRRIKL